MDAAASLADRLDQLITDVGPIPVSVYIEAALYDEAAGFYTAAGGRAGRRGDFLTAPEVGPLFGHVVGRALDAWWTAAGEPAEFVVHEWGAGPGTLARTVLDGTPAVLAAGALRWVAIERSAAQRAAHPTHAIIESVRWPAADAVADVVLANELLDNLPFDIHERTTEGWCPLLIDRRDQQGVFGLVVDEPDGSVDLPDLPTGTRVPVVHHARQWLADVLASVRAGGRVVVFDYGADTSVLGGRAGRWLRTHADHEGTADWREHPGACDITIDVPFDQLFAVRPASIHERQDEWLRRHGIGELVDEGRREWERSAAVGDLAALKARSRIREAEALLDADGMGAFVVAEWRADRRDGDHGLRGDTVAGRSGAPSEATT